MNKDLPDAASNEAPQFRAALEWIGISRIDLPIHLSEPGCPGAVHAVVDAQVNLPAVAVNNVHIPRIYGMLDDLSSQGALGPRHLRKLIEQMFDSHHDCYTYGAKVALDFSLLARRAALHSPERTGWKAYPVQLEARLDWETFSLRALVQVAYSSTFPCSAGQRFEARVSVDIPVSVEGFGLTSLINQVETVLATPVQTNFKRPDEQAFAWLNGQNLMYVHDAVWRIQSVLSSSYDNLQAQVRHLESFHSHDAAASASVHVQEVI